MLFWAKYQSTLAHTTLKLKRIATCWGVYYCRTPDQTKIKIKSNQKSGGLYNCLVLSFFLACHAQSSSDVTLAFEDAD